MSRTTDKRSFGGMLMSYAGWGIGLASLLIAIYAEFIKKDEPRLEYEIISSTDFINNQETSASLRIFVDTLDIQENHLNITAYNIKVENKGTEHIRYDDYDKGTFGLKIIDGQLLEPPTLLHSSTVHIKDIYVANSDSLEDECFVTIPRISLDVEDNYTIRVVLLHSADKTPKFLPEGKIVGQKTIEFLDLKAPEPGFWSIVFAGRWYVHIVRFFIYLFVIAIAGVLFGIILSQISDAVSKRKRKNRMVELSKKEKLVESVVKDYIDNGEGVIVQLHELFSKNENEISTQYAKSKGFVRSKRALEINNRNAVLFHRSRYHRIQKMIDKGYLEVKEKDSIAFNKEAKQTVRAIYTMLDDCDLLRGSDIGESHGERVRLDRLPDYYYEDIFRADCKNRSKWSIQEK